MIVIREAHPGELRAAGDVVASAYAALPGERHEDYLAHVRDTATRARACPILVAVDDDGRVLGSVTYVPGADNPYADIERDGEAGFRMLGVDPSAQGAGIGRRLVEACIDRGRRAGRTALAIGSVPVMTAAHRLYLELGFRRAPERDTEPVPGVRLWAFVRPL